MNYEKIDNLDLFFAANESSINIFAANESSINIANIRNKKNQIFAYCKCGHVHKGYLRECPVCGNDNFSWNISTTYSYSRNLFAKAEIVDTPDGFKIEKNSYTIEDNAAKEEFEIKISETTEFFVKGAMGVYFNKMNEWSFANDLRLINKLDIKDIEAHDISFDKNYVDFDFDKYEQAAGFQRLDSESSKYLMFEYLKNAVPWAFKTPGVFYECLLGSFNSDLSQLSRYKNIHDFIKRNDAELFEPFINESWFYASMSGLQIFSSELNRFKLLPTNYKDLLMYYLEHYKICIRIFYTLVQAIQKAIDENYISGPKDEVFIKYLKDNLIVYPNEELVVHYCKDVDALLQMGRTVTFENIRDVNFLKNTEYLKEERKYPIKKANVFVEAFYDNPLKACYYLKSKKDITKKEFDEFLDSQGK